MDSGFMWDFAVQTANLKTDLSWWCKIDFSSLYEQRDQQKPDLKMQGEIQGGVLYIEYSDSHYPDSSVFIGLLFLRK